MLQTILNKLTKSATGKEIANGSLIFFLTKMSGIALTYLFTFWVTNTMGAGKWGHFALCMNSLNILAMLSLFGFDTFLIRYISEYYNKGEFGKIKKIYLLTLSVSLFLSLLICACIALFSRPFSSLFFNSANMSPWMLTVAVGIPAFSLFQLNNAIIAGLRRMWVYGFFSNILVFGLTMFFFFTLSKSFFPAYLGRFIQGGILLLVTYVLVIYFARLLNSVFLISTLKLLKIKSQDCLPLQQIVQNSYPFFTSSILILILTSTGLYFLGAMKTDIEVGIYDIATKISQTLNLALISVNAIATPKYSEYFSNGRRSLLSQTARQSSKLLFWSSLPIFLIIVAMPERLLSFFGDEFVAGASALVVMAIGNFLSSMFGTVGNLLKMTDHQRAFQNILLAATILNIILNFILIPKYSFWGAAVATTVGVVCWNVLAVWYAYQKLGILTIYIPFVR